MSVMLLKEFEGLVDRAALFAAVNMASAIMLTGRTIWRQFA